MIVQIHFKLCYLLYIITKLSMVSMEKLACWIISLLPTAGMPDSSSAENNKIWNQTPSVKSSKDVK